MGAYRKGVGRSLAAHCEDAVAAAAWDSVSALRRVASGIADRPGTALPAPARFDALPAIASAVSARANFAVVHVTAFELDWLWLGPHDLRRVRARWTDGRMDAVWVVS